MKNFHQWIKLQQSNNISARDHGYLASILALATGELADFVRNWDFHFLFANGARESDLLVAETEI